MTTYVYSILIMFLGIYREHELGCPLISLDELQFIAVSEQGSFCKIEANKFNQSVKFYLFTFIGEGQMLCTYRLNRKGFN